MDLTKIFKNLRVRHQAYSGVKSKLRSSAANNKVSRISYKGKNGITSIRDIEPYSFRRNGKRGVFLFARDVKSGKTKKFNTKGIRSASTLDRTFTPKYIIEIGTKLSKGFADEIQAINKSINIGRHR